MFGCHNRTVMMLRCLDATIEVRMFRCLDATIEMSILRCLDATIELSGYCDVSMPQ